MFAKKKASVQKPEQKLKANERTIIFTTDEINLMRECMKRTEDYYKGLLLLKQDWNPEQNEQTIAIIKVKLHMIDELQQKTLYEGQPEFYRRMQ